MDLSSVRGMDAAAAEALRAAGVRSVADLARVEDVHALAAETGLDATVVDELRAAAQERVVQAFRAVGVADEPALAGADAEDLSTRTGIAPADVEWFQAAAREALGGAVEPRVVLREGAATARVMLEGAAIDGVALVTAARSEDAQALLARAPGDAVLLQEGAPTAWVRVGGAARELPIYQEKDDGTIVRVRVAALKERNVVEKGPSLLGRLLRRRA